MDHGWRRENRKHKLKPQIMEKIIPVVRASAKPRLFLPLLWNGMIFFTLAKEEIFWRSIFLFIFFLLLAKRKGNLIYVLITTQ